MYEFIEGEWVVGYYELSSYGGYHRYLFTGYILEANDGVHLKVNFTQVKDSKTGELQPDSYNTSRYINAVNCKPLDELCFDTPQIKAMIDFSLSIGDEELFNKYTKKLNEKCEITNRILYDISK